MNQLLEDISEYYRNPDVEKILQAVPKLQWRKCRDCNHIDLFSDSVTPAVLCRVCGSQDTRKMAAQTKLLHERE